ncbi:uncharacterized protein LOC117644916 [Thrips palmi]|uniref:Uncharacterized protein LOC117644916 n=1 Tax=Thrips palmi TaxID=161013 RepID=A0A6P8YTT9_THRPL|nr:uncharacterized protein LOC117644916 [Thrips palmi]
MRGYPRKTCKKAQAASMSLLCHGQGHGHGRHGEEGLSALCEGVGGETCYPVLHKLRRPGRGFCGDPQQIGDADEITIASSSARRALQASLIFGVPRRSPPPSVPPSVFGKHSQHGAASANRLLGAWSPRSTAGVKVTALVKVKVTR